MRRGLLLLLMLFPLTRTWAQPRPPTPTVEGEAGEAGDSEVEVLVERIRETLVAIDDALLEAPDADDVGQALDQLVAEHEQVVRDLEELIRQAKYSAGQSGGGGGGGGGQGSSQNEPGDPPPRPNDGSQAPDAQSGDVPTPGSDQPQSREQQQAGQQPEQSQGSAQDPGVERGAAPPPPDPLGDPTRANTDGRWGLLPPKLQERLMNLHVDDIPERYRDWLGAYVRALSAEESLEDGR